VAGTGPEPAPQLLGALLAGRYRVTARLELGAEDELVEVLDTASGEPKCAVLLLEQVRLVPGLEARFVAAARAARALDPGSVVAVLEAGVHEGTPFAVSAERRGVPLGLLARGRPLAPQRAGQLVRQVADALARAHELGVVHGNLSPSSVLVERAGAGVLSERVRLADFGWGAALLPRPLAAGALRLGQPEYVAPERAAGRPSSTATDVYALGALLYELLTGRPPLEGATYEGTLTQQLYRGVRPPSELETGHDFRGLDAVALACLAKHPARRPRSAAAVLGALDECIGRRRRPSSRRGRAEPLPGVPRPSEPAGAVSRWYRSARRWLSRARG
jgi:serine/threonine-protein kinase